MKVKKKPWSLEIGDWYYNYLFQFWHHTTHEWKKDDAFHNGICPNCGEIVPEEIKMLVLLQKLKIPYQEYK